MPELQDGLMSDDELAAILAAQYLKQIFRSKGLITLKVEILLPAHSMDSVRATYRAWLYDHAAHERGELDHTTIKKEEGVAHFFRDGVMNLEKRPPFTPEAGGDWQHHDNALIESRLIYTSDPDLDEDVAKRWKRVEAMLSLGLRPEEFPA